MYPEGRPASSARRAGPVAADTGALRRGLTAAALLVAAVLVAQPEATAQSPRPTRVPGRDRPIIINVRTQAGTPVNAAVALLNATFVVPADAQGIIRIDLRPPLRLPVQVDIHAPGYARRQIMIEGPEIGNIDIYLDEEKTNNTPRAERTVSAGELSKTNQAAAQKLEDTAYRAIEAGDYVKAEELLRSALGFAPDSSLIWTNLGVAILRQGRFGEAIQYLEKGFQLAPFTSTAAGNLGLVRWIQGRRDEAYELLDRAVALGFEAKGAHYFLGVLALGRGLYKQSFTELGLVDPKRFPYRDLYLSLALRGLHQHKPASKAFGDFLQRYSVALVGAPVRPPQADDQSQLDTRGLSRSDSTR
jgi:tetratricopeptide (TPR) repeat protein